jgi:hypothetical protein
MINVDEFKEFLDSPEGKQSVDNFVKKLDFEKKLKINNMNRIKKMFSDQKTFDVLVNRIIGKLDEKYRDKCYSKGYIPHPSNLLYSVFDLAIEEGEEIGPLDGLTKNFSSDIYQYKKWQFAITFGQGACSSVYYKKELKYRD